MLIFQLQSKSSLKMKLLSNVLRFPSAIRTISSQTFQFNPVNIGKVKNEFRAYGNGKIDFTTDKNVGVITLNYPEKRNAISGKMMAEFYDLVTGLQQRSDIKGLILTGQGDFFCAGGDLTTIEVHLNTSEKGYEMACLMHETLRILSSLPHVSVALVNGRAVGGGAELTLSTDLRAFSSSKGKLSFVEAKMGVIPGWGGATMLKNLVGPSKALEILLSCRTISAEGALDLGLCDKIVDDDGDDALEQTKDWLETLVQHDPAVLSAMKKAVMLSDELSAENERKLFAPLWAGPANRAALKKNLKH